MNHLHIADIQYYDCQDASKDKLNLLGNVLKEFMKQNFSGNFPTGPAGKNCTFRMTMKI
jgi:hypothetical protein